MAKYVVEVAISGVEADTWLEAQDIAEGQLVDMGLDSERIVVLDSYEDGGCGC